MSTTRKKAGPSKARASARVHSKARPAAKVAAARRPATTAARSQPKPQPAAEARASAPGPKAGAKLHLTPQRKKKYMELLTRLHEKIGRQISFLANDSLNKSDNDEPRDDVTDDFDRDFALNLLTSEHDLLFEINQAIKRIKDKTYGRCEQCGCQISTARLEAIPFARMCIACQSVMERDKPRYQPFGSTLAEVSRATTAQGPGNAEE